MFSVDQVCGVNELKMLNPYLALHKEKVDAMKQLEGIQLKISELVFGLFVNKGVVSHSGRYPEYPG